jgi:hypothetical protein
VIAIGNGSASGVEYVLNEASVQFRWSSISNTSPVRSSASATEPAAQSSPATSTAGWCGSIQNGNAVAVLPPDGCRTVSGCPARVGGCRTTSPMRLRRRARVTVPIAETRRVSSSSVTSRTVRTTSTPSYRALVSMRMHLSPPDTVRVSTESSAVRQSWSRTTNRTARRTSAPRNVTSASSGPRRARRQCPTDTISSFDVPVMVHA